MPLVNMKDVLEHAYRHNYAVGAFEMAGLEFLEGVLKAAERCRAPVILSLTQSGDRRGFDVLMPAVEAAAQSASVPVSIQMHHGRDLDAAVAAINKGCNGVMVNASDQNLQQNINITREVVAMARGCGVAVEGELGGARESAGELGFTTVAEARAYVERTQVDFLAVSIGTGRSAGSKGKIDGQRLKQLNEALGIPLTIDVASRVSDSQYRRLIANGVAKIDYSTALADLAAHGIRSAAKDEGGYQAVMNGVRETVGQEAERCMRVWGAAGRAAEVLEQCEHWLPVEHVIVYNVDGVGEGEVEAMMAEGLRVLSTIPGVREVSAGKAVRDDARFRYSWLVRFCHPAVIDSYRDHPVHMAFADQRFRPLAGNRISIDYQNVSQALRQAGAPVEAQLPLGPAEAK